MQLRRALPLVGVLFTTGATATIVAACGGDDKTVYVYETVDASTDAGSTRDATTTIIPDDAGDDDTATCQPVAPGAYTFAPATKYQAKCQATDISSFISGCYDDNATSATCAALQTTTPDCYSCLVGTAQDATPHPFDLIDGFPFPNFGICMAAYAGDGTSNADCSYAYGQVEICDLEACIDACGSDDTDYDDCRTTASTTVCTSGTTVLNSDTCTAAYQGAKYGPCGFNNLPDGGTTDSNTAYTYLATTICGSAPVDAGVTDAGADAGDAGDGGDGG